MTWGEWVESNYNTIGLEIDKESEEVILKQEYELDGTMTSSIVLGLEENATVIKSDMKIEKKGEYFYTAGSILG